jgi:hypothetical protein
VIFFELFWESVLGMEGSTVMNLLDYGTNEQYYKMSLCSDGPTDKNKEMDPLDSCTGNVIKNSRKNNGTSPMDLSDSPTNKNGEMDPSDSHTGNVIKNSRKNGTRLTDLSDGPMDIFEKMRGTVLPGSQKSRQLASSSLI